MDSIEIPAGSVVVGVDGSPTSRLALRWAADKARRSHEPLHVIHALETEVVLSPGRQLGTPERPADEDLVLVTAVELLSTVAPEVHVVPHSVEGFALSSLVAASRVAGTLVVGSRGRGAIPAVFLGSVSQQLVLHARCPVVIVRHGQVRAAAGRRARGRRRGRVGGVRAGGRLRVRARRRDGQPAARGALVVVGAAGGGERRRDPGPVTGPRSPRRRRRCCPSRSPAGVRSTRRSPSTRARSAVTRWWSCSNTPTAQGCSSSDRADAEASRGWCSARSASGCSSAPPALSRWCTPSSRRGSRPRAERAPRTERPPHTRASGTFVSIVAFLRGPQSGTRPQGRVDREAHASPVRHASGRR